MSEGFNNGAARIKDAIEHLTEKQNSIEDILREGFERTHTGLQLVAHEIKTTRDVGFIPLPIVTALTDRMHDSYKILIKAFSIALGGIIGALLGLKYLLPHIFGG